MNGKEEKEKKKKRTSPNECRKRSFSWQCGGGPSCSRSEYPPMLPFMGWIESHIESIRSFFSHFLPAFVPCFPCPKVFDMYIIVLFRVLLGDRNTKRRSAFYDLKKGKNMNEGKEERGVCVGDEQNTESCRGVMEEETNEQNRSEYEGLEKASCLGVRLWSQDDKSKSCLQVEDLFKPLRGLWPCRRRS